jgi:hypothetical protein
VLTVPFVCACSQTATTTSAQSEGQESTALYLADARYDLGDMLIIPAGTPHRFEAADEYTLYTVARVDAEKVTPLQ